MRNRKTYFLDLQTLLVYLNTQSCKLSTELKVSGKSAQGSIFLKDGKIVNCLLILQNGVQFTGEQAYRQIEACTEWQVELERPGEKKDSPPAPLSSYPAPGSFLPMPSAAPGNRWAPAPLRQKRPLDPAILQNLAQKERLMLRSVYAMINGKRSNEEIKARLRFSPNEIDNALSKLYGLDLIE